MADRKWIWERMADGVADAVRRDMEHRKAEAVGDAADDLEYEAGEEGRELSREEALRKAEEEGLWKEHIVYPYTAGFDIYDTLGDDEEFADSDPLEGQLADLWDAGKLRLVDEIYHEEGDLPASIGLAVVELAEDALWERLRAIGEEYGVEFDPPRR